MKLVIVESPTKAKTIGRFLGRGFTVESSYGHVRDLPKSKIGIDTDGNFEPHYIIPIKAKATVKKLKTLAKKSDTIILATDEDREGEAIAWHLISALGLEDKASDKIERIVFHEITEKAIKTALKNPRELDLNLVNAQQARRVLDRLVGYKLSPFLWKKIMRGLSAGRVQSAALRLIVEREKEISDFKPEEYWTIEVNLQKADCKNEIDACRPFLATLSQIREKEIEKPGLKDKNETEKIINDLGTSDFKILSVEKKAVERSARPPFTTSTLQQDAWSRLGFSAKKTMMIAQQLYEGVEIGDAGQTGLITYMRTDSVNLSEESISNANSYLENTFGKKYSIAGGRRFKTKSKGAQEAHEAIRPADVFKFPGSLSKFLSRDQARLYDLIWKRFLSTQMPNAIFEQTLIKVKTTGEGKYVLRSSGSILKFDGFLKIYPIRAEEILLPDLAAETKLSALDIKYTDHETQGPPRYTEASLVKTLEKFGIGRPSTYAPIMSTIQDRGYVIKNEKKQLAPTEIGEKVNGIIVENFPQIVDIDFTAKMESELDDVAEGKKEWAPVIKEFYEPFIKLLEEKYETVEKQNMTEPTDEICGLCGKLMVIKHGRFGRFMACSGFPDCKNTKALPPVSLNIKCPRCHEGNVVTRRTRRSRVFFGCSRYPECDFATWQEPTGNACSQCASPLVKIKDGIKCSSKSCDYKGMEIDKITAMQKEG